MASWVTHLMIADSVMKKFFKLDRNGFCVGNIAPDCNVENQDWTSFTPPREVTHWMSGKRKVASDCDDFCKEYIYMRRDEIKSKRQYSFLLGYYAHLLTDVEFQRYIRDGKRVEDTWKRIDSDEALSVQANGYPKDWDSVKKIIPTKDRMHEIYSMEGEYLRDNPSSGYVTEILTLKEFPDYIDYLPKGCITRKIGIMGYFPQIDRKLINPISISREEFSFFCVNSSLIIENKFREMQLV